MLSDLLRFHFYVSRERGVLQGLVCVNFWETQQELPTLPDDGKHGARGNCVCGALKIEMPFPQRDLHIRSVDAPFVIANPSGRSADPAGRRRERSVRASHGASSAGTLQTEGYGAYTRCCSRL